MPSREVTLVARLLEPAEQCEEALTTDGFVGDTRFDSPHHLLISQPSLCERSVCSYSRPDRLQLGGSICLLDFAALLPLCVQR